ncbi:PLD nuclease N-terminal domain-containing protein [Salidesulfovibrio brasiliensis]|uniref:PLD nuclease N-terminal domain-containing protein n=1 Tax=Salidesulfovibrio brasiliensis TaxID=221711 RepID=UPI0006D10D45|nr:PLD nuclease N-terminal domain-containing protein [Salidesulfovibrio brasiliensis]
MLERLSQISATQWALAGLVIVALFAFSAWAILDAWKRDFESSGEKVGWIQLIIFIPVLGALGYVFLGRKRGVPIQ